MADRPAHLAAPAPDSASPGVHARPVLSSCVACKMANPRIELVPRPDPRGKSTRVRISSPNPGAPRNARSASASVLRARDDLPDDPRPRPASRHEGTSASDAHARASAKGCAGSSCARSSSTVLISSERPGTPGLGSDTSRTIPDAPGRRVAVAEMGRRRRPADDTDAAFDAFEEASPAAVGVFSPSASGSVASGLVASGLVAPPAPAPPASAPVPGGFPAPPPREGADSAVRTATWSTAPRRSSEYGGVSVQPPARFRRAGYSARTDARTLCFAIVFAVGAGGSVHAAAAAAGRPNAGGESTNGPTIAARRHRLAVASADFVASDACGGAGARASAIRPAASARLGPASASIPPGILHPPDSASAAASIARAVADASSSPDRAATRHRSGGARCNHLSVGVLRSKSLATILATARRRSASRRDTAAGWLASDRNASPTETRSPARSSAAPDASVRVTRRRSRVTVARR